MKKEQESKLTELSSQLNALLGEDFNPCSPKQVQQLLYEKLRFPVVYHHKTKKATADEDALLRLSAKYPNEPALRMIIEYRKISKMISTFIDVKVDVDGAMRCSYNASGTITGRISSSKTIWGTGMDLHNIPTGYTPGVPSTRHLYIARPGCLFVKGDLKQAEAMVVAWILKSLGDDTLYDLYKDPAFDIHRWCAARFVYQIPEDQVTKEQRQQGGKLANHSGNYMAGPGVMERRARQMGYEGFSFRFCKEILERRAAGIPGLRVWWNEVERQVKATRMLQTCFGRRLHFFERLEGDELRSAVAFEPQSTVGDVCNEMFIRLSNSNVYYPLLTTHDEIVVECQDKNSGLVAAEMLRMAKISLAIRPNVEPLIIPIEISIGKNWRDTEEWHDQSKR
jgi:DNA polymerase-1